MRRFIIKFSFILSLLFFFNFTFTMFVFAASTIQLSDTLSPPAIPDHINLPSDSYSGSRVLSTGTLQTSSACEAGTKSYNFYSNNKVYGSMPFNGQMYTAYKTNIPGLGYIIGVRESSQSNFVPVRDSINTSKPAFTSDVPKSRKIEIQFSWVEFGSKVAVGSNQKVNFNKTLLKLWCYTTKAPNNSTINNEFTLYSVPINLNLQSVTCNVSTSDHTVTMPDIDWLALSKVTNDFYTQGFGETKIKMSCENGVHPKFNIRARTAGGYGNAGIGLEKGSIASGFTLVIRPESTTHDYLVVEPGNTTKYNFVPGHIKDTDYNTPVAAGDIEIPFYFGIYRPNIPLVPGTYTALTTFTFSYQ